MTLDALFQETIRTVVREEMRAVLREHNGDASTESLLTYAQAAKFAQVSKETIGEWVRSRALKAYGRGRVRRVKREDLLAAMGRSRSDDDSAENIAARLLRR